MPLEFAFWGRHFLFSLSFRPPPRSRGRRGTASKLTLTGTLEGSHSYSEYPYFWTFMSNLIIKTSEWPIARSSGQQVPANLLARGGLIQSEH